MKILKMHQAEKIQAEDQQLDELEKGKIRLNIEKVGICGSDLHYFFEGRCGDFIIREPFTPGHEASASISQLNDDSTPLAVGDRIALNPSQPCGSCTFCLQGRTNLCEKMSFYGSASTWPHTQGLLRQSIDVLPTQCHKVDAHVSFEEAACGEPLAVAVHSARRAGDLAEKNVLVLGAGPIGNLIVAVCNHSGAHVVAVDLHDQALAIASKMGASLTVNITADQEGIQKVVDTHGHFDVIFEVTGNSMALDNALPYARKGGKIVQVGGFGKNVSMDCLGLIMSKELDYLGSFRFTEQDYADAVELVNNKKVDLQPILSATLPFEQASDAFKLARDRKQASKVHLCMRGND